MTDPQKLRALADVLEKAGWGGVQNDLRRIADEIESRQAKARNGGKVGGPARAKKLSARRRSQIARMGGIAAAKKKK